MFAFLLFEYVTEIDEKKNKNKNRFKVKITHMSSQELIEFNQSSCALLSIIMTKMYALSNSRLNLYDLFSVSYDVAIYNL